MLNIYLYLTIMKKILGFILLSIGGYMLISLVMQLLGVVEDVKETVKAEVEDPESFALGNTIGMILIILISLASIFFGYILLKKANQEATQNESQETSKKK